MADASITVSAAYAGTYPEVDETHDQNANAEPDNPGRESSSSLPCIRSFLQLCFSLQTSPKHPLFCIIRLCSSLFLSCLCCSLPLLPQLNFKSSVLDSSPRPVFVEQVVTDICLFWPGVVENIILLAMKALFHVRSGEPLRPMIDNDSDVELLSSDYRLSEFLEQR